MRNTGPCVQGRRAKGASCAYIASTDDSEGLMTFVQETINGACWVAAPSHIEGVSIVSNEYTAGNTLDPVLQAVLDT